MGRLFVWLAGGDKKILRECLRMGSCERRKLAGIGAAVLIPAVFGFFAMSYAAFTTLSKDPRVYVGAGAVWFCVVLTVDRSLASTFYRSRMNSPLGFWGAFAIRLLFAGLVGTVVSHPLVQFVFRGAIDQHLAEMARVDVQARLQQVQRMKEQAQAGPEAATLRAKDARRACLERVLEAEQAGFEGEVRDQDGSVCGVSSGKPNCGLNCRNIRERVEVLDGEIRELNRTIRERVDAVNAATEGDVAALRGQYDPERVDYLQRANALAQLEQKEPHVRTVKHLLLAFFIFLDTMLILLKGSTPAGEYEEVRDSLLHEARETERVRREVATMWAESAYRSMAMAERMWESRKGEMLAIVGVAKQFIQELDGLRTEFERQMSGIAKNVKELRDEDARRIYLARLSDLRDTFNVAWGKAMTRFQEHQRSL